MALYAIIYMSKGKQQKGTKMATVAENNIRALEMIVEELEQDLNAAITAYEDTLEYPDEFDDNEKEAAKRDMEDKQRYLDEAKEELESEIAWNNWDK